MYSEVAIDMIAKYEPSIDDKEVMFEDCTNDELKNVGEYASPEQILNLMSDKEIIDVFASLPEDYRNDILALLDIDDDLIDLKWFLLSYESLNFDKLAKMVILMRENLINVLKLELSTDMAHALTEYHHRSKND